MGTYNQGGVIGAILDNLLGGGRYEAYGQGAERVGVDQCARAVEMRVNNDFPAGRYGRYIQGYDNRRVHSGNNRAASLQVVRITRVERKARGLKVSGLIETGIRHSGRDRSQAYGNHGYDRRSNDPRYGDSRHNQAYGYNAQYADLRLSCRVDYRGRVTNLDIKRNNGRRI